MSHTPGPWFWPHGNALAGNSTDPDPDKDEWSLVLGVYDEAAPSDADARLIAAAPELLEALEGLLKNSWQPDGRGRLELRHSISFDIHRAATDAVAKATGEQP